MHHRIESNLWRYSLFSAISFTPFFLPTIVLYWKQNGLDQFDVFLLQGLFALAVVLLEVPTGMIADRLGKRTSLIASTVIFAVGFSFYAVSSSFLAFLLVEIFLALGLSLYSGADSALLYDTLKALDREREYKQREGRAKAVQMLSFAAANLLGGFVGSISYQATLWMTVIGPVLGFFVALGFVEANEPEKLDSMQKALREYKQLLKQAGKFVWKQQWVRWQIVFLAVLTGSSTWLLWLYQPYMKHSGLPIWAFGIAFAIFNSFAALASHYAHLFEQKLGQLGSILALMGLQIGSLLLMGALIGPLSFLFILGHQAVRGIARPIISDSILKHTYADKRATVLSIGSLMGRLFFTVTAPLIGWLTKGNQMATGLFWQAGILLLLFAFMLFLYRRIPYKYFKIKAIISQKQ